MLTAVPRITAPGAGQERQVGSGRRFSAPAVGLMCRSQSTGYDFGLHCVFSPSLHSFCRFLLLLATRGRGGAKDLHEVKAVHWKKSFLTYFLNLVLFRFLLW